MAKESDLIGDVLERMRRIAGGRIADDVLRQVEREARAAWSGRKVYVSATGRRRKPRAAPHDRGRIAR